MLTYRDSSPPTCCRVVVYLFMLVVALSSIQVDFYIKNVILRQVSDLTQKALQLTAVAQMERGELGSLRAEANRQYAAADSSRREAATLAYQQKTDMEYAKRFQKRGEFFANLVQKELNASKHMEEKAEETEELREKVLANLTMEYEIENHLLEAIQNGTSDMSSGLCTWAGFRYICEWVGGVVDLQHQANVEAMQILKDEESERKLSKTEFLEVMVANMLEDRATKYNHTANELLAAAAQWQENAARDGAQAEADNETAEELTKQADRTKHRAESASDWNNENSNKARQFLNKAKEYKESTYKYAIAGVVLSTISFGFFLYSVIIKLVPLVRELLVWSRQDVTSDLEFGRIISSCLQHAVIFMVTVGLVGAYFVRICEYPSYYSGLQRAALVAWFAYLGSGMQALVLHVAPHIYAEGRFSLDFYELGGIAKHYLLRMGILFVLFSLEVLFVWLTAGPKIFSEVVVQFWQMGTVRLLAIISILAHFIFFEIPLMSEAGGRHHRGSDASTVMTHEEYEDEEQEQDDIGKGERSLVASERTPLHSSDGESSINYNNSTIPTEERSHFSNELYTGSRTPTEELPLLYFSNLPGNQTIQSFSQASVTSLSPYFVRFREDILKLWVASECLLVACSIHVFLDCLHVTFTAHPLKSSVTFLLLLAISVLSIEVIVWRLFIVIPRCCQRGQTSHDKREIMVIV